MKTIFLSAVIALASTASGAATFDATDSYYTFGFGVSSNQERLLADKAQEIGFAGLETISFILFDVSTFLAPSRPYRVSLQLEQDSGLAGTLIPAAIDRELVVGAYALDGTWDPVNGNLTDARYGNDGDAAFDLQTVRANGVYSWDVTELFREWLQTPASETAIVITGLFGNTDTDGRNTYASFYAANSLTGTGPQLVVTAVPLPAGLPLILAALCALGSVKTRRRRQGT
ncbi:MAG: DNRLRE domain-containing protein [Pseudomonadota bacterium]